MRFVESWLTHGDEGDTDQADNEQDFGRCDNKLRLAIPPDCNNIDESTSYNRHRNPNRRIHARDVPILHDRRYRTELRAHEHDTSVKVGPSERQPQSRVDISRSQFENTATDGQPAHQLCRAQIARPDETHSIEQIAEEQG